MRRWPIVLIALIVAAPALARLGLGGTSGPTIPDDVTLPVSSTSVGAVSANSYTGWTNPADTAGNSTNWTSPSTSIRYLFPVDSKYPIATTTGQWRDVEVTTWVRTGCVLVRWSSTTAVYFEHQGESTNGSAAIGVITGINPGGTQVTQCPAGARTSLASNSDLVGTVPGYSKTDTAGDTFTFGCAAWTCYIKFNGTEFLSVGPDIRLPMEAGTVALSVPSASYGFRDASVDWLPLETIYSKPPASIYDMRDFGFYSVETTGSITSGSSDLTVVSSAGYAVGDEIIVECGTEAGACARNTVGVGGVWPAAHYADDAAMNAAVPCTANSYAYLEDTGKVRQCRNDGGAWNAWPGDSLYYLAMKVPRALSATITAINGNVLTLDTAASATATNANVYRDSTSSMDMFDDGRGNTTLFPVGSYVFAENIVIQGQHAIYLRDATSLEDGPKIIGAGLNKENERYTFFAPDGAQGIGLIMYFIDYSTVDGVFIRNNIGLNGYGLYWTASGTYGSRYPSGIQLLVAPHSVVLNSGALDSFASVTTSFCFDCHIINAYARVTEQQANYIAWQIQQADSQDGTIVDSECDSNYLLSCFEGFRSDNIDIIRPVTRNGQIAMNSTGGGWLIDEPVLIFGEDIMPDLTSFVTLVAIQASSNIQPPSPSMEEGGTIRNMTIVSGYWDLATHFLPVFISIESDVPNITIEGTYPTCSSPKGLLQSPGWYAGNNSFEGIGVRTGGDNTIITGIRFDGDANYAAGHGNIHTEGGSGKDVTVTNNVMDHSATGTSTITQTGTITNAAYEALCP